MCVCECVCGVFFSFPSVYLSTVNLVSSFALSLISFSVTELTLHLDIFHKRISLRLQNDQLVNWQQIDYFYYCSVSEMSQVLHRQQWSLPRLLKFLSDLITTGCDVTQTWTNNHLSGGCSFWSQKQQLFSTNCTASKNDGPINCFIGLDISWTT